ncbi:MarR family winged helix-turn-helix transcriptional regulator [Prevotella sp. E2-28]|uniref:MarR family winged helix-turn-helix transcriptional regulator n=1 Tax=Prevotella sp. E2-28 TaxID=2913620 RepID=UPI001EDBA8CF|nr:MarR family transcriptional regulator [Prevotella sp. E2-28]UKK55014.1 MarR family transcriptional regulator [Prevotella sp. E2-28]
MMHEELRLDKQVCFRLYTAARLITQAYTPMLNELGITYPQYLVLMVLWEQDNQPVNDIAHKLLLETNTVTPLLQRMEKLGIVVRKRGKEDKRQQIVSLTEKGREMEEQAYAIIPAGMSKALGLQLDAKEESAQQSCPLQLDDYVRLASELDTIIDTLKNKP